MQNNEESALNDEISIFGDLKIFNSKQKRIQKKKLLLFPNLQETLDTTVGVELMKIFRHVCIQKQNEKKHEEFLV